MYFLDNHASQKEEVWKRKEREKVGAVFPVQIKLKARPTGRQREKTDERDSRQDTTNRPESGH